MNQKLENFHVMLEEPVATTGRFHEVMSQFDEPQNQQELLVREHMEYLLQMMPPSPQVPSEWRSYHENLARIGSISTITIDEVLDVLSFAEKPRSPWPNWKELADRVIQNRKKGDPAWRMVAEEKHRMLIDLLK